MDFLNKPSNTYPTIQVVRDGQEVPFSRYTNNEVIDDRYHFNQVVDPKKLGEVFSQERSSIRIFHAQRNIEKVAGWCRKFEAIFCCPVQANIYLSPPESRGFGIHFDRHDVFVLQLEGAKNWKIYDSPIPFPLHGEQEPPQEFVNRVGNAKCIYEGDLNKGDLLYVPKGYIHEVSSGSLPSIHITFGVRQLNGYDSIRKLVKSSHGNMSMRKSLPISAYQQGAFEEYKRGLIRIVAETLDREMDRMSTSFMSEERAVGVDQIKQFYET